MTGSPDPTPRQVPALLRDERALVEALRSGDVAVLRLFLEHTHAAVHAFACRYSHDPEQRRDWSHTVLLRIVDDVREGRFVFRHAGGFWSWFRKRAGFLLLDECRNARKHAFREGTLLEALPHGPIATGEATDDPAAQLDRASLRADVEHCLERIASDDQRHALRLLLEQEFSYDEIAASLGSPVSAVRNWIHRARVALRHCLMVRWGIATPSGETSGPAEPSSERP